MRVKTAELIGPALDWAVTSIESPDALKDGIEVWIDRRRYEFRHGEYAFRWQQNWKQGGPIIERAGISISLRYGSLPPNHVQDVWDAIIKPEFYESGRPCSGVKKEVIMSGPFPLIAAMRCFVASKLGDEIDVPEELMT